MRPYTDPAVHRTPPLAVLMLGALLGGCSSITITEGDGTTRVDHAFGFARVEVTPGGQAVTARIESLGISDGPAGLGIGVSRQEFAAMGEECRVVLWVKDEKAARALIPRLDELNNICVIEPQR